MLGRTAPAPHVAARVRELLDPSPGDGGPRVSLWQRLAARVPVRLDPGRRAAVGVGLAVALAAVLTGIWLAVQRPHSVAVPAKGRPAAARAASPVPVARAPAAVVVDVAGKVRHPGLYRLPAGARIDDAIRRAGGPLAGVDLASLNLAARLVDGQQILVGRPGAAAAGGGGGASGAPSLVDLNTAAEAQLDALPGVGPVLAQHIVEWRNAHGQFSSVDQLNDVPGIGAVKFAALRPLVTV